MKRAVVIALMELCLVRGENLPPATIAERGKVLMQEDFAHPVPSLADKTAGKKAGRWRVYSGQWECVNGGLRGEQLPTDGRSAFVLCPLALGDAVIQFDVRFDGARQVMFRVQDAVPEHICRVVIRPDQFTAQKDDHDHAGPDTAVSFGSAPLSLKQGDWSTVLVEIKGSTMATTIGGKTITGTHPLIAAAKASIDLVVTGKAASFRNICVWEAKPRNP